MGKLVDFNSRHFRVAFLLIGLGVLNSVSYAQDFSENAEIYVYKASQPYNVALNEFDCLNNNSDSEMGCYYVVLQHPVGLLINYSEETQKRIPQSQQAQFKIKESEEGLTSILISDMGGGIDFVHADKNIIMASHRFPSAGSEDVFFYDVRIREQGTPLYWDDEERPEGEITWVRNFNDGETEESPDIDLEATQNEREESGTLLVNSDVDADVVINGNTYSSNRGIPLSAGVHEVLILHELGNKTERVEIKNNEQSTITEYFKPIKSDILTVGVLFPGVGHISTNRNRGWAYLLGTLGGVGLSLERSNKFNTVGNQLEEALDLYNRAGSIEAAEFARNDVELLYAEQKDINRQRNIAILGSILIYSASLIDLFTTEPRYGFRKDGISVRERFSVSPVPTYNEFGIHASVNVSISW